MSALQTYIVCERLTEALIYFMVVFSPWAFGTTQWWSIWTMNVAGYALGGLLAVKFAIRHRKGHRPPGWDTRTDSRAASPHPLGKCLLAWVTVAILVYCLISALNAQYSYDPNTMILTSRGDPVKWLPHSLDASQTWAAFWNYLALAGAFWAAVDWLPVRSLGEHSAPQRRAAGSEGTRNRARASQFSPARLGRLLWVLTINGGLLAFEGIMQRYLDSDKLLFLIRPGIHREGIGQFGPYAYRSNAAQYFNLLWPVCLGFWWTLRRSAEPGSRRHYLALICTTLMAAAPIVATTRAGALITVALLVLASHALLTIQFFPLGHRSASRRHHRAAETPPAHRGAAPEVPHTGRHPGRSGNSVWPALGHPVVLLNLFALGALLVGLTLGWKQLNPRLTETALQEGIRTREEMYEKARPIAELYPVFGTGPGTFASVNAFYYRLGDPFSWGRLHNDWLETRITFGWVGSALIALALVVVVLQWFVRGGIQAGRRFIVLCWLAMAGIFVFAAFDFPFQIYSILFLFLILCAMMVNLTRKA